MATNSPSLENLVSLYKHVTDDVVKNMKEEYLNEGVDPELLEDLRRVWLGKLNLSGAISRPPKGDTPSHPPKTTPTDTAKPHPPHKQQHTPIPKINVPGPPPLVSVSSASSVASNRPPSPPSLFPTPTPSQPSQSTSAESASSVIQLAPPRITPTSASQATPQLLIHPGMLAAAQASKNASVANVAQGVLEQLQQASAAGGGGSGGGATMPTAGTTPSIMPFPLNLVNSTVGQQLATFQQGMVPLQTPQGTVLIPLQTFMSLGQMKQNQSSSSSSSSQQQPSSSNQEKEVVQLDGLVPLLNTEKATVMSQDTMSLELMSHSVVDSEQTDTYARQRYSDSVLPSIDSSYYTHCDKTVKHWNGDSEQSHSSSSHKSHSSTVSNRKLKGSEKVIVQLDGATGGDADSSSSEDESDLDDSSEDELGDGAVNAGDEDPLCSDDDVSDEETSKDGGDFDTQDTIVCQWEKVYRVKNKWKFQLKDGIMHLGGFDYVFQKVNGEADW